MKMVDPLCKLYLDLSRQLTKTEVRTIKSMLTGKQIPRADGEDVKTAMDIFVYLEDSGQLSAINLTLLDEIFDAIKRSPLKRTIKDFQKNYVYKQPDITEKLGDLSIPDKDRVTELDLLRVAEKIGSSWEMLTIKLGMKQHDIDRFKTENPNNMTQQISAMLREWRQRQGFSATNSLLRTELEKNGVDYEVYKLL